ncbi:hypothetical protein WKH56_19680 [Priestia sp. SB1]|uniref:hypothetical protein n=1 Tax=Priestia sp. SB1 TaxID=3132359 RepID=UPI00316F74CC
MGFDGNNATSKVTALHNGGYVKKKKRKVNLDLEAWAKGCVELGDMNLNVASEDIISGNQSENITIELVTRGEKKK